MLNPQILFSDGMLVASEGLSASQPLSVSLQQATDGIRTILLKIDRRELGELNSLSGAEAKTLQALSHGLRRHLGQTSEVSLSLDLRNMAHRFMSDPTFAVVGEAIFKVVAESRLPDWEQATHALAVHQGTAGSFAEQVGKTFNQLSQGNTFIPMALAMSGAGIVGRGTRAIATNFLKNTSLLNRGGELAVHLVASMIGLGAEAGLFPALHGGANLLVGQKAHLANYGEQVFSGLKMIGGLRLAGRGALWLRRGALGLKPGLGIEIPTRFQSWDLPTRLLPLGAELGTLSLLNVHERPGQLWAANIAGALGTVVEFRVAGGLSSTLAPQVHLASEQLDRRAYDSLREVTQRSAASLWQKLGSNGAGRSLNPQGREALAAGEGTLALPGFERASGDIHSQEFLSAKMASSKFWTWRAEGRARRAQERAEAERVQQEEQAQTAARQERATAARAEADRLSEVLGSEVYFESMRAAAERLVAKSVTPGTVAFHNAVGVLLLDNNLSIRPLVRVRYMGLTEQDLYNPTNESNPRNFDREPTILRVETSVSRRYLGDDIDPVVIEGFPCELGRSNFFIYPETNQIRLILGREFKINGQNYPKGAEIIYDRTSRQVISAKDHSGANITITTNIQEVDAREIYDPVVLHRMVASEAIRAQFDAVVTRDGFVPLYELTDSGIQRLKYSFKELRGLEVVTFFTAPMFCDSALKIPKYYRDHNRVLRGKIILAGEHGKHNHRIAIQLSDGNKNSIHGHEGKYDEYYQGPVYVRRVAPTQTPTRILF